MHRFAVRAVVLAAATTLALTATAGPAVAGDTPRDELSAQWLAGQLTDGLVRGAYLDEWTDPGNPTWVEYIDHGLSVDTALALDAIGGHDASVTGIGDAMATQVASYTTGVDFGTDDVYAGATAKALVLAQTVGADPATYGGTDLVTRLNRRIATTAPIRGRLRDKSAVDYANVVGQTYAVQGLAAAGSGKAGPALAFLLKQQCDAGYFRLSFTPSKSRRNQSCEGGNPATTSAPDTDATALAVLGLTTLHSTRPSVRTAITDAVRWLKAHQKGNGSYGGGTSTEGSNANSTGLASWALGVRGACGAASAAATWVSELQVTGAPDGSPLAGELGGIAYSRTEYTAAQSDGIPQAKRDQWRRATTQAAPALSFGTVSECRAR